MRYLFILLLLQPLAYFCQSDVQGHMNFQTRWMVEQKSDHEVVSMFIRGDVHQITDYLKGQGRPIKGQVKNLIYTNLSISEIKFLAKQNFVEGFEWEWGRKQLMNDTMLVKNKVEEVHSGMAPLPQAYTGKGVISGVIDTGIDPLHRDFQNLDSSTRVMALWDQTLPFDASLTPSFGYGQEFDSAMINTGPIAHFDGDAHGTGVASVMAGNGWHSGELKGVASESDLVVVELDFSGANLNASVDAFKYIYDFADVAGMPCVINASYGDYLGSHDGLDAMTLFLDSLLDEKPGRFFVAAAGNSGDWGPYHVRHTNSGVTDTSFTWFEPNPSSTVGNTVFLDIWGDTANMNNLNFSIGADHKTTYAHGGHLNFRNIIADGMVGTTIYDSIMNGGKMAPVEIYTELRGGQYNLQVYLPGIDSANYNYSLISTGTGEFDLWSISYLGIFVGSDIVWLSDIVNDPLPASGPWPDVSHYHIPDSAQSIVTGFQCNENVVTVGQYVNRANYTDFLGAVQTSPQLTDSLAMNSSAGPTRLGLHKPDVNSTGFWVMSALPVSTATTMQGGPNAWRLIQSGYHTRRAGTSFSSPVVAGLGVLLLEKCPNTTAQEFVSLLHATSYGDQYTGVLPNYRWGYGKTDAFALLTATNVNPNVVGDTAFCYGGMTTLTTDSTYSLYDWNGGSAAASVVVDSTVAGYLLVENSMGCKSDTVWYNVEEYGQQVPATIVENMDTVSTNFADSIQWYLDGAPVSGATDTVYLTVASGYYMAEHIDSNGCSVFSDSIWVSISEMNETEIIYSLFPNPADKRINFSSSEFIDKIELRDVRGRIILSKTVQSLNGELDLTDLATGSYIVKFISGKESHISKIQVVR